MNFKSIYSVICKTLILLGWALILTSIVAIIYSEDTLPFLLPALFAFALNGSNYFIKSSKALELTKKETILSVSLSWLFISIIGSFPYLFSNSIPEITNAVFESISGFTTTGSSILSDIEALPKSVLFWRSMTHWIGGIGIIVLVIIVMPSLRVSGYQLFSLESSLQDKIRPKIVSVGKRLLMIYLSLTLLETILLCLEGMPIFDSICHSFGTIATGGFSTKNDSLVSYSPIVQYTVAIFMLLSGTNFIIYYYLFNKQFKDIKRNDELRFYYKTVFFITLFLTASLYFGKNFDLELAFRESFFQLVSIITSTGFATADYLQWPIYAIIVIFFAMFLGGSTGSTAGGVKMARYVILYKNLKRNFIQQMHPNASLQIKLNNNTVSEESNQTVLTFIMSYFLIFILGSVCLACFNVDIKTASSSVATCLAGIGPGIGKVGPMFNFNHFSDAVKLILSLIMLMGRLEIYAIMVLVTPTFWKNI